MRSEKLICSCFSDEHNLQFTYDEEDKVIYTTIYLHQYRSFFKRVWVAIKYIFGYHCKYGHWDTFNFDPEDYQKIIDLIKKD